MTLAQVIERLEQAYPPRLAQSWDAVGLVCGDPKQPVRRVLVCVDVTADVVDYAIDRDTDLIVAHHPLLMGGVTSVAATNPKGALLHRLIGNGCALYTAHTNADAASPGVSDALAALLGIVDLQPIEPNDVVGLDKWGVMVPVADVDSVQRAMFDAGAGQVGDYRDCSFHLDGRGQFLPLEGAQPAIGQVGDVEHVNEVRVEMVAAKAVREAVRAALVAAHPYQEPAYDIVETVGPQTNCGLGRVGRLSTPMTLRQWTQTAATALPSTEVGVRAAGDPDAVINRVAVCGGAGDSLLGQVRRMGVDAYLTGDLRHHPVDEHLRAGGPALIDAGHWATEFPWCAQVAGLLADLETEVFDRPTDPWTVHSRA